MVVLQGWSPVIVLESLCSIAAISIVTAVVIMTVAAETT